MDIKEFAQKTIQRFGTHDPFDICNQLGIVILYLPLGRMRGYCYSTFVCERKLENEVNAFAVCLLFPDDNELLENCSTISELSIYMGVRLELAQLRSMYIGV